MRYRLLCSDVFFFFKQKTAYEMRISDWSSDVCSSDLPRYADGRRGGRRSARVPFRVAAHAPRHRRISRRTARSLPRGSRSAIPSPAASSSASRSSPERRAACRDRRRSEEHTSELQSLMRISYAVFCLKKNKTETNLHHP